MGEKTSTISKTAGKYPQESYAAVVCAIQLELIFLQHINWDTGDAFAGVDKMIRETFLPRLFFGKTKTIFPVVGTLSIMLVKKSGLGFLNPVTSEQEKYLSPQQGSAELFPAMTRKGAFSNAEHLRTLSEEQRDGKKDRDVVYKSKSKGLVSNLKGTEKRLLICDKVTGVWLSVLVTTVSGTLLFATEK